MQFKQIILVIYCLSIWPLYALGTPPTSSKELNQPLPVNLVANDACLNNTLCIKDFSQLYTQPNKNNIIMLSCPQKPCNCFKNKTIILKNYAQDILQKSTLNHARCEHILSFKQPNGYYEFEIKNNHQSVQFGIVNLPTPYAIKDNFFGIDLALTILDKYESHKDNNGNIIDSLDKELSRKARYLKILQEKGISIARERMTMGNITTNQAQPQWKFSQNKRLHIIRKIYNALHFQVLEDFHSNNIGLFGKVTVDTQTGDPGKDWSIYPEQLTKYQQLWQRFAQTQHGEAYQNNYPHITPFIEIWNEPDGHSGHNLPLDQNTALVKTINHALKRHKQIPLVGLVSSHILDYYTTHHEIGFKNNLLDYIDAISFHSYQEGLKFASILKRFQQQLKEYGYENKPLWVTESGYAWTPATAARPDLNADHKNAFEVTLKAIEAKALGIERYFPFVGVYHIKDKNSRNYGFIDQYYTPIRITASYFNAIQLLSNSYYIGDLPIEYFSLQSGDKNPVFLQRTRVFKKKDQAIIACVIEGNLSSFKTKFYIDTITTIDGQVSDQSQIIIKPNLFDKHILYITTPLKKIKYLIESNEYSNKKLLASPRKNYSIPAVAKLHLENTNYLFPQIDGYQLRAEQQTNVPFTLRVYPLERQDINQLNYNIYIQAEHQTYTIENYQRKKTKNYLDLKFNFDFEKLFYQTDHAYLYLKINQQPALAIRIFRQANITQLLDDTDQPLKGYNHFSKECQSHYWQQKWGKIKTNIHCSQENTLKIIANNNQGKDFTLINQDQAFNVYKTNGDFYYDTVYITLKCLVPGKFRVWLYDQSNNENFYSKDEVSPLCGNDYWQTAPFKLQDFVNKNSVDQISKKIKLGVGMNTLHTVTQDTPLIEIKNIYFGHSEDISLYKDHWLTQDNILIKNPDKGKGERDILSIYTQNNSSFTPINTFNLRYKFILPFTKLNKKLTDIHLEAKCTFQGSVKIGLIDENNNAYKYYTSLNCDHNWDSISFPLRYLNNWAGKPADYQLVITADFNSITTPQAYPIFEIRNVKILD